MGHYLLRLGHSVRNWFLAQYVQPSIRGCCHQFKMRGRPSGDIHEIQRHFVQHAPVVAVDGGDVKLLCPPFSGINFHIAHGQDVGRLNLFPGPELSPGDVATTDQCTPISHGPSHSRFAARFPGSLAPGLVADFRRTYRAAWYLHCPTGLREGP